MGWGGGGAAGPGLCMEPMLGGYSPSCHCSVALCKTGPSRSGFPVPQRLLRKQRRCAGSGAAPHPPTPGPPRPPFSPFLSPSDPQGKALGGPRVPPVPALPSPLPSALPLPAVSGSMSELPPPGPGPGPASRRGGFALGPPQPRSLPGEAARSGPEAPALPAARPSPPAAGAPGAAQPHGDGPEGRRGALAEQKKGNGALRGGGLGGGGRAELRGPQRGSSCGLRAPLEACRHPLRPPGTSCGLQPPTEAYGPLPSPVDIYCGLQVPPEAYRHSLRPAGPSCGLQLPREAYRHLVWPIGTSCSLQAPPETCENLSAACAPSPCLNHSPLAALRSCRASQGHPTLPLVCPGHGVGWDVSECTDIFLPVDHQLC